MTAGDEAGGMLPELPPPPDLSLVIPTNEHLLQLREQAKQAGKLMNLRQMAAAWQDVADRCHLTIEELARLAVFRLEVERDLGTELAQTVHRGGDRPASGGAQLSQRPDEKREELEVGASDLSPALPAPVPMEQGLRLPPQDSLQHALEVARGVDDLKRLREMAATYQDVAQRFKVAKDELVRLAIWRIDVERKLGDELARTVGRGGRGSKFQAGTSKRGGATRGLPDLVNKGGSKRYQDLAAIPEELLREYYSRAAARGVVPSPGGARGFAARVAGAGSPRPDGRRPVRGKPAPTGLPSAEVLEAVQRFFGRIDVVIGDAQIPCRTRLRPEVVSTKSLTGAVFVAGGRDTVEWLPKLAAARLKGGLDHVVAALPALTGAAWFRDALETGWVVCFLPSVAEHEAQLLAYHGTHTAPWDLVFRRIGALACGSSERRRG